jgi:anti-sigma B factor antagonist
MKELIERIYQRASHPFGSGSTGTVQSLVIQSPKGDEAADTIALGGRITNENSGEMRAALTKALHGKPPVLHVNLSGVSYIDTSGVATLVEAAGIARRQHNRMILEGLRDQPRYLLEITRLDRLFDIVGQEGVK